MALVTVHTNEDAVAPAAAERATTCIEEAIEAHESATVCLTGGRTLAHLCI